MTRAGIPIREWCDAATNAGEDAGLAARIWSLGPQGEAPPRGWRHALGAGAAFAPGAGALIESAPETADVLIADDLIRHGDRAFLRLKPAYEPLLLQSINYAGKSIFFRDSALGPEDRARLEGGAPPVTLIRPGHRVAHLPYPAAILREAAGEPAPAPAPGTPPGPIAAVVPNRNSPRLIRLALDAILGETGAPPPVVVIVDNGSDDAETLAFYEKLKGNPRVFVNIRPEPFNFSSMVNRGAALARDRFGEIGAFLLLNNDIESPATGWLARMAETLGAGGLGAEVGIVGAKLLFPDRTIQHAGVIVGHGGVAGHELKGAPEDAPGLLGRMRAPHLREAVTAAAMLIRAETWDALGGFDERAFPIAFNDVDFCLRAGAAGWRVALDPRAVLIHHEGVSRRRPFSLRPFLAHQRERAMLRLRHRTIGRVDRFESPWRDPKNLTPTFRMLKAIPPIRF